MFELPLHVTKTSAFIISGDSSYIHEYTKNVQERALRLTKYFLSNIKPTDEQK